MTRPKILLVDDERIILSNLSQQLKEGLGNTCEIELAENAEEALEICHEIKDNHQEVAIIISDQLMPGKKGDEFLIEAHRLFPQSIKILLTGQASTEAIQNAINNANLYRYISKPWEKTDFLMTVKEAFQLYQKNKHIQESNLLLESLYENSKKIQTTHHSLELLKLTEKITFQEIDLDYQIFYDLHSKHTVLSYGPQHEHQEFLLKWILEYLPLIQKQKYFFFANKGKNDWALEIKEIIVMELSEQLLWMIGTKNSFTHFAQNWIKLFSENVKTQLQKCYLFESLEQKVEERTREVKQQAAIIQEQNQDIIQSMQYARRIQKAILPQINQNNCPLNFHYLYQPRDVISGDFYWYKNLDSYILFAIGDCTGHGVPGAMLSTLSISLLNQLIADYQKQVVTVPNIKNYNNINGNTNFFYVCDFLNQFALNFSESLNRTQDHHAKDGLEIGMFLFNTITYELQFAGANMNLWVVRKQNLIEIEGCKQSIEGWNFNFKAYKNNTFICEPNDFLILFTDGIPDQFGGDNDKKFGYKRLREFFIEHLKPENSPNQLDWLYHKIKEWQGNQPQTDDRLCFVFKV